MNLAGMHDREAHRIALPNTWLLDTVALSENPTPVTPIDGINWITRLNWGYGSTGTLPVRDQYGMFAEKVRNYVAASQGCTRWIIGNEPNLAREWPDGIPIYPWDYADCYLMCRMAIHSLPGHERDEVLIAAPGPWNAELKYPINGTGDWITYFEDVIDMCGIAAIDGFALHTYTHGYNVALVTSSARMQPPFQNRRYEFRTYIDYLEAIPADLHHLPVYITETNGNGPWQAVGLMPAMLNEIDNWNKTGSPKVQCLIFFRYPKYDQYFIEGKDDVIQEFYATYAKGYLSPGVPIVTIPEQPQSPQNTMPPRSVDPRAVMRGVKITEPTLMPGQTYWRAVKVQWYNEQEADALGPDHHLLADVLDASGNRKVGTNLRVVWPTGAHTITTEAKPGEPYSANYPMSPSRNEFSIRVADALPSDIVSGIGMGADTPSGYNAGIHTSTGVVFQLVTVPESTVPTQPPSTVHLPSVGTGPKPIDPTVDPTPQPIDSWQRAIDYVLKWEGGFQNNPADVGNYYDGKLIGTKYGISAASWGGQYDIPNLTLDQAKAIYKEHYWKASGADKLPWPYSLMVMDTAVLHGVGTAKKWVEEVGDNSYAFAAKRLQVYTKLKNWKEFGAGWTNRTADLLWEAGKE